MALSRGEPFFVAVEGNIGSGKTEFAKRLGRKLGWRCVFEDIGRHPFIREFYADPRSCALETEISFVLMHRFALRQARRHGRHHPGFVTDFSLQKDPLFASVTLGRRDREFFMQVYAHVEQDVPRPDLLVYLRGAPEVLLSRIARRGRPMEQSIPVSYLAALNRRYEEMVAASPSSRTLVFDIEDIDWQKHRVALRLAINRAAGIVATLGS